MGVVGDDLGPEALGTAALLAHELVMNSVRHSGMKPGEEICLTITRSDYEVMVEVCDTGCGFKPPRTVTGSSEGGMGLQLIQKMATRWGMSSDEHRTAVWFYLRPDGVEKAAPHAPRVAVVNS